MPLLERLVYLRNQPGMRRVIRELLALYGVDFPPQAQVGTGLLLQHRAVGLVVSGRTILGSNVTLYQGVTIGGSDVYRESGDVEAIEIRDHAIISAGAKVLGKEGRLIVGEGTIIGANAVLLRSTGDWEIWGGVPARKLGLRPR